MLIKGFGWGTDSNDELFLHRDICKFESLDDTESRLDHQIIEAIQGFVEEKGLVVVKRRSIRNTR